MSGKAGAGEQPNPSYSLLWDRIYEKTCRMVGSLAARYRVPPREVEDLQHDAYCRIHLALRRFDAAAGEASIATWMYKHARWEVIEHFRRRARRLPSVQTLSAEGAFPEIEDEGKSPADLAAERELERAKEECIEGLQEPLRSRYRARIPRSGPARTRAEAARLLRLSEDTMRDALRLAVKVILLCMHRKGFVADPPPAHEGDGSGA